MVLINDELEKKVCFYEKDGDLYQDTIKLFVEELITTQVKEITYCLLKTLLLSNQNISKTFLWHLFFIEEKTINPIPYYENKKFKFFCENIKIKVSKKKPILFKNLFSTPIRVLGGYFNFGDEGRINNFLAKYNSYLRLYLPFNKQYRISELKKLLNFDDDKSISYINHNINIEYILGYIYPITSFGGVRLFIFMKEKGISPLFQNYASGCQTQDAIYIRQVIIYRKFCQSIDLKNINIKTNKSEKNYHIHEGELESSLYNTKYYIELKDHLKYRSLSIIDHEYTHVLQSRYSKLFSMPPTEYTSFTDNKYQISYYTLRKDIFFFINEKKSKQKVFDVFQIFIDGTNLGCEYFNEEVFTLESILSDMIEDNIIIEEDGFLFRNKELKNFSYAF